LIIGELGPLQTASEIEDLDGNTGNFIQILYFLD
jgi:hypothetical protein